MKRGQLQISFGMIFSIIIIIATVAIAFYVINYFIKTSNNLSCKMFHKDLQDRITSAWNGEISQDTYISSVPMGVKEVCIGDLTNPPANVNDKEEYDSFKQYSVPKSNFFFYPRESACNEGGFSYRLDHIKSDRFFCITSQQGKASIKISKGISDSLVTLS
ncbi:hypothetical protein KW787_02575 [Candidatus Pacearchaeota archaeon]|nr:hypothetical protein [Candidatus Pacearchaeota archaeon]